MFSYIAFVLSNWRLLSFGFLLTFFASFGQTYFIGLFGAEIRQAFQLSHGEFGTVYSIATLTSAPTLIWLGRFIDRTALPLFAATVCLGMAVACLLTGSVTSIVALTVAIYLLRLMGQGLMSHAAITSMARYFVKARGRAVSFAALGYPCGEAIFPIIIVAVIASVGWRGGWFISAALVALLVLPVILWLVRDHRAVGGPSPAMAAADGDAAATVQRQWTRAEMLRDRRFHIFLPAYLAPSYIITGLMFHQIHLVEEKGWSLAWFATCFVGYAITKIVTSLLTGPFVDRFSAVRLLPVYLLPLVVGLGFLAGFDHPVFALVYMMMAGASSGVGFTIVSALWAEVYGVQHLGAIRALTAALMVMASALSPASLGWLFDLGVAINQIAWGCFVFASLGMLLTGLAYRR